MTKIKSPNEWAEDLTALPLFTVEDGEIVYSEDALKDIAALIREAQAEAWEAGRESALMADSSEFYLKEMSDGYGDGMSMEARSKDKAIRTLPNPFKESKGDE